MKAPDTPCPNCPNSLLLNELGNVQASLGWIRSELRDEQTAVQRDRLNEQQRSLMARLGAIQKRLGNVTFEAATECAGPFERYTPYILVDSDGTTTEYPEQRWHERACAVEVGQAGVMRSGSAIELSGDNSAADTDVVVV